MTDAKKDIQDATAVCAICGNAHPTDKHPGIAAPVAPLSFHANNRLVALVVEERWQFTENDSDIMQALHQTTGRAFMLSYLAKAANESVIDQPAKAFESMSDEDLLRQFKMAYDRYQSAS